METSVERPTLLQAPKKKEFTMTNHSNSLLTKDKDADVDPEILLNESDMAISADDSSIKDFNSNRTLHSSSYHLFPHDDIVSGLRSNLLKWYHQSSETNRDMPWRHVNHSAPKPAHLHSDKDNASLGQRAYEGRYYELIAFCHVQFPYLLLLSVDI